MNGKVLIRAGWVLASVAQPLAAVDFAREVLPILSDNCLSCHGPDEKDRKAGLRLDTREGALEALVPGDAAASELLARVLTEDADELMPPPESHKPRLNPQQVAVLRQWIEQGAPWAQHWAFVKPVKQPVQGHPVDFWVREKLRQEGLKPAAQAESHTLLRRVALDLTGLGPSPELIAKWQAGASWDEVVEALLESPHYGERMAMWWLDLARYADTDGFQSDATRTNWPWRDWVVKAFNENLGFDAFTRLQFAGDLESKATAEQVLATCFHRNHMTNGEGGRDPEESRVDYVIDRVNTVGAVWLGLTLGCAQCHTHKFDPIQHRDYYQLAAFFNSIDEDGKAGGGAKPFLAYQSVHGERTVAEAKQLVEERVPVEKAARAAAQAPFADWLQAQWQRTRQAGFQTWQVLPTKQMWTAKGSSLRQLADLSVVAEGANPRQDDYLLALRPTLSRITGLRLEVLPSEQATRGGLARGKAGEFILTDIKVQVRSAGSTQVREIAVANAVADVEKDDKAVRQYGSVKGVLDDDPRNGWTTAGHPVGDGHQAVFALAEPLVLAADEELVFELQHRSTDGDANLARFRLSATDEAGPGVRQVGATPLQALAEVREQAALAEPLRGQLFDTFLADHDPYQQAKAALERAQAQLKEAQAAAGKLNVMVLKERKEPRATHVLERGVWDKPGEKVERGVPVAIAPWEDGLPRDRRGLADWLMHPEHPLTARVLVNHVWQMLFGTGLVRTADDFGLQGEAPSHPELLDSLAVSFRESGWDIKALLRWIVTSETYRQDSAITPELLEKDPQNRLLARGARFRLPAWMIRDAALHRAGLLNPVLGGPPVRPYQPAGVWEEIFMGRYSYLPSEGAAQHRRTLYAFWRRSSAPTFLFDSAQRRVCEVTVSRTNTPLQALTLMNDESLREAARAIAQQASEEAGVALVEDDVAAEATLRQRLQFMARQVLGRELGAAELPVLMREQQRALAHYSGHPAEAAAFLKLGQKPVVASAELAALTLVCGLLMNLDEAITHE
jgi:hypothetical protein